MIKALGTAADWLAYRCGKFRSKYIIAGMCRERLIAHLK
jgi:hypothetical protein